ncbi:hypothetical protein SAMN04488128_108111 [Chitinophaga eiseniae]|uniref:DUF4374 domain-containing protein n=1 Tax=Chitinophaga eiseniae TaxID=634771 RepID=A0A1T4U392_9BACT|nr:hypothetical protein [Chitinophaga eiseniae]SKA47133.1 hypothetical protein SAMN04488128_108111 [Chitinophaga eiseniae]
MSILTRKLFCAAALLSVLTGFSACEKYDDDIVSGNPGNGSDNYAIWMQLGSWPNTTQYVVGASSLTSGAVSLKGNGVEVTSKADYGIIPHKGYYYYPSTNSTNGRLSKYSLKDNQLTTIKEVPFTYQTGVSSYTWVDDATLVLMGTNGRGNKLLCSVVDANTLAIKNMELPVNPVPAGYAGMMSRSLDYINGKLYVGLVYTADWPAPAYPKAIVAIFDYPSMKLVAQLEDGRSVGMGQANMWMSGTVLDDKGDYYLLSSPGWLSPSLPSAVYKISAGQQQYDASYFFNMNQALGGPAFSMYSIGNGRAIVKYKAAGEANTDEGHIYGYAIVDLVRATVVRKLTELPLDKGESLQTVMVEGNNAYIMVNAETGKDYVWIYDIANGTVNTGLEIAGGYDYLLRIDKLK